MVPPACGKFVDERFGVISSRHDDEADPHVESAQHDLIRNAATSLEPGEDRRYLPRRPIDRGPGSMRKHTWQVVRDSTAGTVRHPFDATGGEQRLNDR